MTPRFLLPASLVYDYRIDPGRSPTKFTVCEEFLATLDAASAKEKPLERADLLRKSACFNGACATAKGQPNLVVCPGGLWGFRHSIGLPVSLESDDEWAKHGARAWEPGEDDDPPSAIDAKGGLRFAVSISTDKTLKLWSTHEKGLRALRADLGWHFADTLEGTYELFKMAGAQIVYFYCHGGLENKLPYIQVGPVNDEGIFSASIRGRDVRWTAPRPLVFINGCHTTAVEPEIAHDLVTAFVANARASGVIGTEITIFEPLAREFAETFFLAFFAGQTVGEAVRTARLAMLGRSNPLGLAYTAYALSSLKLTGLPN